MRWCVVIAVAVLAAGCGGNKNEKLPVACTDGPAAIVKALAKAPAPVTIDGTPISHCFNRGATSDDIQILGTLLLAAAEQLGDRARSGDGHAALKLGYLVGAAERGNKRNNGAGAEMVRRVEAESAGIGARQPDYNRGLRAGLSSG